MSHITLKLLTIALTGPLVAALHAAASPLSLSQRPTSRPIQSTPAQSLTNETAGEGGVEATLVTYADTAQGFAIGPPRHLDTRRQCGQGRQIRRRR